MSSDVISCGYCKHLFPDSLTSCPHCAQPQLFPNVAKSTNPAELKKLDAKLEKQKLACDSRGTAKEFTDFLDAASASHALFACPLLKLHREIAGESEIFETFYQLEALRLRTTAPKTLDWGKIRPQAETELLGSDKNKENLHYACLSLDWESLTSYGDCIVQLEDRMIAHRASCFEGNTAVIYFVENNFSKYLRSNWAERGKIAAAALGDRLKAGDSHAEFAKILVAPGKESVDDEFIEVHVFGTMTARTFSEVRFASSCSDPRKSVYRDAIKEKLDIASIKYS